MNQTVFIDTDLRDLKDFPHLPGLRDVRIIGASVTDFGVENLCTRNPALTCVRLTELAITDKCFPAIRRLPNLDVVYVSSVGVPAAEGLALQNEVARMSKERKKGRKKGPY
jgi:hypothetical protein